MYFDRAIIRVFSEQSTDTTMIEVKRHGIDKWEPCITYKEKSLDKSYHTYIATGDTNKRRTHFVHSVKFYDNEV